RRHEFRVRPPMFRTAVGRGHSLVKLDRRPASATTGLSSAIPGGVWLFAFVGRLIANRGTFGPRAHEGDSRGGGSRWAASASQRRTAGSSHSRAWAIWAVDQFRKCRRHQTFGGAAASIPWPSAAGCRSGVSPAAGGPADATGPVLLSMAPARDHG